MAPPRWKRKVLSGFYKACNKKMIRQLGHKSGRSYSIGKIPLFAVASLFLIILFAHIFNLTDLIFKGPKAVMNFITDSGLKSSNNRTNILLLGVGGEGHEGPYLSDTMILASIDKKGKDVALISIPRDLWVPDLKVKINAVYAFGFEKKQGIKQSEETVSKLFGVPVHYTLRLDFSAFERAVDQVGGIDVVVDNPFTDSMYPIPGKEEDTCGLEIENKAGDTYFKDATGTAVLLTEENNPFICRYETVNFQKGTVHMDGKTALKFVRSRHGTNGENSDFARSARQEKVIAAFRQKVFSSETLLNPKRLVDVASTFGTSIDTDIKPEDAPLFIKLAQKAKQAEIRRIVLDSGRDTSVLEEGKPEDHNGQFALVPKNNAWQELAEYMQAEIFKTALTVISSPTPKSK